LLVDSVEKISAFVDLFYQQVFKINYTLPLSTTPNAQSYNTVLQDWVLNQLCKKYLLLWSLKSVTTGRCSGPFACGPHRRVLFRQDLFQ